MKSNPETLAAARRAYSKGAKPFSEVSETSRRKALADARRKRVSQPFSAVKSLWGELPSVGDIVTPLVMLRQQAGLLKKTSRGMLDASVSTVPLPTGRFRHSFYLVAPLLGNYRHLIFTVEHGIDPYPAEVKPTQATKALSCPSQKAFENLLPKLLQHPDTRKAISALMENSQAVKVAA